MPSPKLDIDLASNALSTEDAEDAEVSHRTHWSHCDLLRNNEETDWH